MKPDMIELRRNRHVYYRVVDKMIAEGMFEERVGMILKRFASGEMQVDIANDLNVSRERIRFILNRYGRAVILYHDMNHSNYRSIPITELQDIWFTARCANALTRAGIKSLNGLLRMVGTEDNFERARLRFARDFWGFNKNPNCRNWQNVVRVVRMIRNKEFNFYDRSHGHQFYVVGDRATG